MGSFIRLHERRTEKRLAAEATKGVVPPHVHHELGYDREQWAVLQEQDPDLVDRRSLVPRFGLREYWYPAIPEKKVPKNKPLFWKILGDEIVLFRDEHGEVTALTDVCPHRGASLAQGSCFYEGTVACPYHGAVFDREGECKAFITEGPDSRMPGNLTARSYPTVTLKDWVWIWMGSGEPAPLEDDIPPEFFEDEKTATVWTYTYWPTNWIIAIENQNDAHNAGYVHRNSAMQLMQNRARKRTPMGPRSKLIEDRALVPLGLNQAYYADESGEVPYQMHYPGVGDWPIGQWRRRVWSVFKPYYKYVVNGSWRKKRAHFPYESPAEWGGSKRGGSCWHLPSAIRINLGFYMYTRYAVPVTEHMSRIIYFHHRRIDTRIGRLGLKAWFHAYFKWWNAYNFSGQDDRVASPSRYWTEENLAPTDSHLMLLRKLITERSRDARKAEELAEAARRATKVERRAAPGLEEFGLENDLSEAEKVEVDPVPVDVTNLGDVD